MFQDYRPTIMLRTAMQGWRRHARKNGHHKELVQRFTKERMGRYYDKWRGKFLGEQAKIHYFNKTIICIKNNIAKRAFKSLALNALKGRLKKRADVHCYKMILYKTIWSFQKQVNRRKRSIKQFDIISKQARRSTMQGFFI